MRKLIRKALGIDDLEKRVNEIENRLGNLENTVKQNLRHFGQYKDRTLEELNLMKNQISDLLETVEHLVKHEENKQATDRAIRLRKRLRNNLTRINKNIEQKVA